MTGRWYPPALAFIGLRLHLLKVLMLDFNSIQISVGRLPLVFHIVKQGRLNSMASEIQVLEVEILL